MKTMTKSIIDSTELRQQIAQEIDLIPDDKLAELYQFIHYFRLGSEVASNGAMVSNNGTHPELLNSPEELNIWEDAMDSTNEGKSRPIVDPFVKTRNG